MPIIDINKRRIEMKVADLICEDNAQVLSQAGTDLSASQKLKEVLIEENILADAEWIFLAWPNLKKASLMLCDMLVRELNLDDKSILCITMRDAVIVYKQSVAMKEPDLISSIKFLQVLSNSAFHIQKIVLYTFSDQGDVMHWPYFSISISKWIKKLNRRAFYVGKAPPASLESIYGGHIILSSKIFSQQDLGRLSFNVSNVEHKKLLIEQNL